MKYEKVLRAKFIERPNRFIARVSIDGQEEMVHVKNTGRCKELLIPGAQVILEDCSHNKNRKTRYSVIGVYKGSTLINMDSQVPNQVVFEALKDNKIEGYENLEDLKREVSYKNSRFDIYFKKNGVDNFLEVKGVTLEENGVAMFPDAPTERGRKHLLELIDSLENKIGATVFLLIQMKGPKIFRPQWERDPDFSQALVRAEEAGVKILAYDSIVTEDSIEIGRRIEVDLTRKKNG